MTSEHPNTSQIQQENSKTIFNCWSEAIKRFFDFSGRTTRYEFWAFQTVSLFIFVLAALIGFIFDAYKIVFEIYALYFLAPAVSVSVRRLHDINLSGRWIAPVVFFALLTFGCWEFEAVFTILPTFLLLLCISYLYWALGEDGEPGDNIYGEKVREPAVYNQDSKVFITFMIVFLAVLWLIFLYNVLFS